MIVVSGFVTIRPALSRLYARSRKINLNVAISLLFVGYLIFADASAFLYVGLSVFVIPVCYQGSGSFALSFVEALYFSVITMTTVGYGDIYPCTDIARVLVCVEVLGSLTYSVIAFSVVSTALLTGRQGEVAMEQKPSRSK